MGPNRPEARAAFATYYDLLAAAHALVQPLRYVEIGVHTGLSLALAAPGCDAVGVDPALPGCLEEAVTARLVATTSDEFFDAPGLAGPVDLGFVDGLHLAEQALRDIANLERHMDPGGAILVHDCVPIDAETSSRDRTTIVWSGDVWKVVPILREARPDLRVSVLDVGPTGMGVITGLDPSSRVLHDLFDDLVGPWLDRSWEGDRALLDPQPSTRASLAAALGR
jgi:hypothetical protein